MYNFIDLVGTSMKAGRTLSNLHQYCERKLTNVSIAEVTRKDTSLGGRDNGYRVRVTLSFKLRSSPRRLSSK